MIVWMGGAHFLPSHVPKDSLGLEEFHFFSQK